MQSLKKLNGGTIFSYYLTLLDIKIIFSLVSNVKKILNLTSDPIIIQTLICSFVTFFEKFIMKREVTV